MSETSIFGDLDIESAADDPFKVPPSVYNCIVEKVEVGPTKDKSKVGMTIIYKITEGDEAGKSVREWKQIPTPADPKNLSPDDKRAMSFLKARMLDLGIPETKINSVKPEDLIAKEVTITVKDGKNDFTNVTKVTLLQNVSGGTTKKFK
jgi:hypothetical protein